MHAFRPKGIWCCRRTSTCQLPYTPHPAVIMTWYLPLIISPSPAGRAILSTGPPAGWNETGGCSCRHCRCAARLCRYPSRLICNPELLSTHTFVYAVISHCASEDVTCDARCHSTVPSCSIVRPETHGPHVLHGQSYQGVAPPRKPETQQNKEYLQSNQTIAWHRSQTKHRSCKTSMSAATLHTHQMHQASTTQT